MSKPLQYKLLSYCFVEDKQYFGLGQLIAVSAVILLMLQLLMKKKKTMEFVSIGNRDGALFKLASN